MVRMSRFVAAGAVAALAVSLAACSSGDDEGGAGSNLEARGPITFAMGKNDIAKLEPIVQAWNAQHPDEEVSLHELAGENDSQRDTLIQSLQARSGEYDVFALDVTDTAHFAANGFLEPLQGDFTVDTSGLLPSTVESATYNGTLYAVPQNTNAQLLYYRSDLLPQAPTTWDNLLNDCNVALENNVDCLHLQAKQYSGLTVAASQFINSWGGGVVGEDGKTPAIDSPEARAGLEALVSARKSNVIPERALGFTEEETNLAFLAGETLFSYNWPYMYTNAEGEGSTVVGKFGVAPIVGPNGAGASTLGGYNNGINAYSESKATAKDFAAFVISEESQLGFAEQSFPPVLASIYDDAALVENFPYLPALKAALENARPRPVTPFYPAVDKAIQDNVTAALRGQKTVDNVVADVTSAITQAGG